MKLLLTGIKQVSSGKAKAGFALKQFVVARKSFDAARWMYGSDTEEVVRRQSAARQWGKTVEVGKRNLRFGPKKI